MSQTNSSQLTIGDAFSTGWSAFKEHIGFALLAFLVLIGLAFVVEILILVIVGLFLLALLNAGAEMTYLNMVRGQPSLHDYFLGRERFWPVNGVFWLRTLIIFGILLIAYLPLIIGMNIDHWIGSVLIGIGVLTLIAGWIIANWISGRLILAMPLVIETDLGVIDCLKESFAMTDGSGWSLFWILILATLLAVAGVLICGIGMFFTTPLAYSVLAAAQMILLQSRSSGDELAFNINDPKPVKDYS